MIISKVFGLLFVPNLTKQNGKDRNAKVVKVVESESK